jgi:hypothetical protein
MIRKIPRAERRAVRHGDYACGPGGLPGAEPPGVT